MQVLLKRINLSVLKIETIQTGRKLLEVRRFVSERKVFVNNVDFFHKQDVGT